MNSNFLSLDVVELEQINGGGITDILSNLPVLVPGAIALPAKALVLAPSSDASFSIGGISIPFLKLQAIDTNVYIPVPATVAKLGDLIAPFKNLVS